MPRMNQLPSKYFPANKEQAPWALVTGASDGIGAEYCRQLASDGFNIVLVSRTLSKLKAVEAEIKAISTKV